MSKIAPALTPEEWGEVARGGKGIEPAEAHGVAARNLFGQPFGFTHADVRRHREEAEHSRRSLRELATVVADNPVLSASERAFKNSHEIRVAWHESMADRLAALLPPGR